MKTSELNTIESCRSFAFAILKYCETAKHSKDSKDSKEALEKLKEIKNLKMLL